MAVRDILKRPLRGDVVVGVACTGFSLAMLLVLPLLAGVDSDAASLALVSPFGGPWWLIVVGLIAQGITLLWAGRGRRQALLAVATIAFGLSWAAPGATSSIMNVAVLVMVFHNVAAIPLARLRATLATSGLLVAAAHIVAGISGDALPLGEAVLPALGQSVAVIGLPLIVGLFVRARRDVREARRDEQRARTGERDAQIREAVARERTAMARELHDIAAHHLSGIALMAAVVDRQIDADPERAHRGVRQVRAQSTMVLDDLRRLVGLLRDDTGAERSVETLATVTELVDRAQAQGPIELQILAPDDRILGTGVGPLAQLSLYRTIQEALTNAATHAPGAMRAVRIDDRDDAAVEVTVTNNAPGQVTPSSGGGGFGLLGMRERADLVGADLGYGPTPEGGWRVRVSVPRDREVRRFDLPATNPEDTA